MKKTSFKGKDILEYSKDFSVLYVEDDVEIQKETAETLRKLFKTVYTESNGVAGIDSFKENRPDIVITDIQMPLLDGIDMIRSIKSEAPSQRFIITTAFNEASYYAQAIKLGVEGFIIKPINSAQIYETLYKAAKNLYFENAAKDYNEYLEKRVTEEVEKNTAKTLESNRSLSNLIEAFPNPAIVFSKEGEKIFSNGAFGRLFPNIVIDNPQDIDRYIIAKEGLLSSLNNLSKENNKASVKTEKGRKIFNIIVTDFEFKNKEPSRLYTFDDTTLEEYGKLKIKHYNETLKDLYIAKQKARLTGLVHNQVTGQTNQSQPAKEAPAADSRKIDSEEHRLLRKSYTEKTTALEYKENIDEYVLEQIAELEDLEKEFEYYLYTIEDGFFENSAVGAFFKKYSSTMSLLFDFEILSQSLNNISNLFYEVDFTSLEETTYKKLKVLILGLFDDIKSWRNSIFVDKMTKDIHYLDSSLFSSCLQLEVLLHQKEVIDDQENDLDLF